MMMEVELDSQEDQIEYMVYDDSSNDIQELPHAPQTAASGFVPSHMMETQPIDTSPAPTAAAAPPTRSRSPGQARNVIRAPSSDDDADSEEIDVIGEERPRTTSGSTVPVVKNVVFKNSYFNGNGAVKQEPGTAEADQCDVKLIIGPGPKRAIIPVQKELLGNIPYFRTLLKEQQGPEYEISLPQLTKEAVNRILDYHSSGQMLIPESIPKIHDLMKAAVQIRMDQLITKCIELLKKMLSLDNCLELRQIAAENSYTLANDIDEFIRTNFHRLYTRPEFLGVGYEGFQELIAIYTKHGEFRHALIYKAIVAWVRHEEDGRSKRLPQLMKLVNLASVLSESEGLKREDFDILEKECPRLCLEAYKDNYWSKISTNASASKAATKRSAPPARGRSARLQQASDSEDSVADPKRVKQESATGPADQPSSRGRAAARSGRSKASASPAQPARTTRGSSRSRTAALVPTPKQQKQKPAQVQPAAASSRRGARGTVSNLVVELPKLNNAYTAHQQQDGQNAVAEAEPVASDTPSGGLRLLYSLKQKSQSHLYTYDFVTHDCRPAYRLREHRFLSSVIVHGDRIFDIGGTLDPATKKDSTNVEIFEKGKLNGKAGPHMKHRRKEFGACVFEDAIYVIGGCQGTEAINCVETLPLNQETHTGPGRAPKWAWMERDFLNVPRGALGAATIGDKIFAVGGIGAGDKSLATVEVYDDKKNGKWGKWTESRPMSFARGFLKVATLNDKMYAVGGRGPNGKTNAFVEWFDAGADKWVTVASMHHARREFGLVTWEGQLYAIGGNDDKANPSMERYDPRADVWEILAWPNKLHQNTSFLACAVAP